MGDFGPSALQSGHVALRFPCVWSTEETPERETLQLGQRTQGHCEGLVLITATGILRTRNPAACSSLPWPVSSPVKKVEKVSQQLLEEEFPDESSSDEDYKPIEEEV
ncbi:hypothetical protein TNCV_4722901 [Trichonephila clavipes]|uniref:Uncharacterized protein n=1 Tax=Trichonephila clavipes TaxID=2585209 RepID=A0A8X7BG56_TRICX|nr:hypothetical protein TNCV_4722901 [Trichonephila clavipes]